MSYLEAKNKHLNKSVYVHKTTSLLSFVKH